MNADAFIIFFLAGIALVIVLASLDDMLPPRWRRKEGEQSGWDRFHDRLAAWTERMDNEPTIFERWWARRKQHGESSNE